MYNREISHYLLIIKKKNNKVLSDIDQESSKCNNTDNVNN